MRLHFAAIPVLDGAAEEEELNRFFATHRVISVDRQLVDDGPRSVWTVCVSWVPGGAQGDTTGDGRKSRVDYRETLNEAEFAVFSKLRDARKALAERDSVPPYAIFTNEQFAEMLRRKVRTLEDLARIEGVGPARVEKYGTMVIELLRTLPEAAPTASAEPTPAR